MPPDLTSLFDVLFIVIFACLIRAAAAQHSAEAAPKVVVEKPRDASAIVRVSAAGKITAIEAGGKVIAVDVPLLEASTNLDVVESYLGDRASVLQVCSVVALHLGLADLAKYVVIFAPDKPLADLPHALYDGLHRDVDRCAAEQHGWAVIVAP